MRELLSRLEADPYNLQPLKQLERRYNGEVRPLVEALETHADQADDPQDADTASRCLLEAGRLAAMGLDDPDRAQRLVTAAIDRGEDTYVSIEAHLFDLALKNDVDELLGFFTDALEHFDEPAYQSRLYLRMGTILSAFLGDAEEAHNAYTYAVELEPTNLAARWAHQDLLREQQDWAKLAELLYDEVEGTDNPADQARASVDLGRLYRDHLGDDDGAIQCFQIAAELDPDYAEPDEELEKMGVQVNGRDASVDADDPGTMELDDSMLVAEEPAEDSDDPGTMELDDSMLVEQAVPPHAGGAEADQPPAPPADGPVEEANGLDSDRANEVDPVADELMDDAQSGQAGVDADREITDLSEDSAGQAERAGSQGDDEGGETDQQELDGHREETDREETDREELEGRSDQTTWTDRFETLVDQVQAGGDNDETLSLLARACRLEAIHHDGDDDRRLSLWELASDRGVAAEFYRRTSFLWSDDHLWETIAERTGDIALKGRVVFYQLGRQEKAAELAAEADDPELLSALDDVEAATANWRKFQRALEQRHSDLGDEDQAYAVFWHMADMAAGLDDLDKEINALRRLDRQVDDPLVSNRLKTLYERAGKWTMYIDLLKKEVDRLPDDRTSDKIDLLYEAIRVYSDEINNSRKVGSVYQDILEIDPENLEAIDALIEMYEQVNRATELINMLQRKADLVDSKAETIEIYEQVADLFLEKFRNKSEAIKTYETILELSPEHAGAIDFLKEMYEKRRDWQKLIDIHKQEIDSFETDDQKAAGFRKVAKLATDRLRKPEVATELWLEVRRFAPDDPVALDALEKLYEKSRDFEKLADILETKVDQVDDIDQAMKLFQKLGMLYSDRLDDTDRAIAAWKGALELDGDDLKARKALERLLIDSRDWDALEEFKADADGPKDLVRVLETLAGTMKQDAVKIELLLRAGRIWQEVLDDTSRAERDLERARELDPDNEQAALQLEPIARSKQDYEQLGECYQTILEHRDQPEERREYQLKLAELHSDPLDDPAGAFRWYADAFYEDPAAREVTVQLDEAAHAADAHSQLADAYREALDSEQLGEETRQHLRLRLGRVLAEELDHRDEALSQFEAVLEVQQDHLEALAAMERIYRRSQRWDELMTVYRRRLESSDEVSEQVAILQGMAEIAETQAGDVDTAIEHLDEALELDADNQATLEELHRLYARQEAHEQLADIIRQEIALIEQRADAREVRRPGVLAVDAFLPQGDHVSIGQDHSEAGFDAAGAADGGQPQPHDDRAPAELSDGALADGGGSQADGVAPDADAPTAAGELDEASDPLADQASEAAIDALSEAQAVDDPGQAFRVEQSQARVGPAFTEAEIDRLVELRYELGVLSKRHLDCDQDAVDLLGYALSWRPLHHQACQEIEGYLDDPAHRQTVARDLTVVFELQGQWNRLIDALDIRVDEADDIDQKVGLLEKMGRVQIDELGNHHQAFDTYCQLLRIQPESTVARAQLRRVAGSVDRWEQLVDLYEDIRPGLDADELRIEYLFDLGEMYGVRLGDIETAQRLYNEALDLEPDSARALQELEALYAKTEQWDELHQIYERQLERAETVEETEMLRFKIVVLFKRLIDQPRAAIEVLEDMIAERPNNRRAVHMLSELFRGQQMWDELADNIRAELDLVDAAEQNEVKNRLAAVIDQHLDDSERAVDLYEQVLGDEPTNADALSALEGLMDRPGAPTGRASRILEPLYADRSQWDKLIDALEVQLQGCAEAAERVELLHRIATLHEDCADRPGQAFSTYGRALGDGVDNEDTIDHLYRLAEQLDDWDELATQFEAEANNQAGPDVQRDLLWRAARVHIDHLDAPEPATELLRDVQALFPADLEAVEVLEKLYRQLQAFDELVDILVAKASLVDDEAAKKDLLYQAGATYEDILDRPEDAVEVYQSVLDIDDADGQAIDRLEVIYSDLAAWQDLLTIYQRKLDLAADDEARKDLLYAMGPIYEDHLNAPFEAIETYEQILDIDSDELAALECLDRLLAATDQWNELLETLDRQMNLVALEEDELDLRYRKGRIWEAELGDVVQAIDVYSAVLEEAADHEATIEALDDLIAAGGHADEAAAVLEPIYRSSDEWDKLVEVYRRLIESRGDTAKRLQLYRDIAGIYEDKLNAPRDAFDSYVEALRVDPGAEEVLEHLERLSALLKTWEVLIERVDEIIAETSNYEAVPGLNLRVARIYEEQLHQLDAAIDRYKQVVEGDPDNPTAIVALDRLYQQEGRWDELAEIVQTRVFNAADEDQTLELQLRLGTLYQDALDRPDEAIEVYQTILLDHPDNQQAIQSLRQMFMAGEAVQKLADILEPYYLEKGRHENLVEIYLQRLETLEDRQDRHDMLMQVGRIFLNELQDQPRALSTYGSALFEKPDDPDVIARIAELAEATGAWGEAAGFYVDALDRDDLSEDDELTLWVRLAQILDERLDQPQEAEGAYQQALEIDPGEPRVLESLDQIYQQQQRWDDLADILQQRIAGLYDEEQVVELSFRLAGVFGDHLDAADRAVDTYHNILDIRPRHSESLRQLEAIHLERQDWQDLFGVLRQRAEGTHQAGQQVELFSRMANLAEEMLDRPLDAIDLWNEVIEIEPTHRDALGELQRLYLDEQRWDELVGVLEREVELADEPAVRLELYDSLGTIWQDKLNDEIQALDAWRQVLDLEPTHLAALEALRDIYTRQGDYAELPDVLGRLIDHEHVSNDRKQALWIELGEIYGDMLLQPHDAIEAWKNVMSLDPGNDLALENLERLYLQESMWEEAAEVLEVKVDGIDDDDARINQLTRIADIWENKLFEPSRAVSIYEQILDVDPTHMQASHALETIYRDQADADAYQRLVELYLTRAEVVADDPFERVETLRSAAQVFEEHLDQPESALLVELSAFGPATMNDDQLNEELERLADQTDQWDELVGRATDVLDELDDDIERADLNRCLGRWYADKLDQPDDAVYHLRQALGIEPDNSVILERLEELYREIAAWPELADILHQRIELATGPDERIELWRSLGELSEMQMGEAEEAIEAYRQILVLDDSDIPAMERLERILEAYDRWDELIAILRQKADATYEPSDLVAIKERIAAIYEQQLQDPDAAIDAYQQVLTVDQTHQPSLEALETLYLDTDQWDDLLDVYEQRLGLTHEPDEQVEIYAKMAAVYEEQFGDLESAVDAYNSILAVQHDHLSAFDSVERLYRSLERWFDLVDALQRHVEFVDDDSTRVGLFNELARVRRDQLEVPHEAIEAFLRSVEIDSTQPDVYLEVADLHEQVDSYEPAVDAYTRLVDLLDTPEERAEIYCRMGEILEEHLLDDDRAEDAYLSTLDLVAGHTDALRALRRIYERKGDWQPLIRALKSAEDASHDLDQKADYLAEIGELYEDKLDDRVSALNYYESALESDASHVGAAEPLIGMYIREQRWERAVPLLELVIEAYQKTDAGADKLHKLHLQAAETFQQLAQHDQALDHYREAYEQDSTDFDTLKGLGHLLFDHEDYEKAATVFETLEFQHVDKLDSDELVQLYHRAGEIRRRFGETRRAVEYFVKALDVDPHNQSVLEALIEQYEDQQNWEQVVAYSRQLLETEQDAAAQFALLVRIGELLADELDEQNRAVHTYLEALEIDAESMSVLRKLLNLYTDTNQWFEAVDILQRLIEHDTDSDRIARYNYTVGVIFRDEIDDAVQGVEYFDAALDEDVKMLKAFEAIDRILTQAKEWKELERAYRRMLRRVTENDDGEMENIKILLWTNLGEIYRSRLGHVKSAIGAYEAAVGLKPDDQKTRLILAELYEKKAGDPAGAIDQHKELINIDPFRIESYRALFKAYIQQKQYDRAWCMAAALNFLQSANDQEDQFYNQYLGQNLPAAKGQFQQELYRLLYHPSQEMLISFIMNILGQGLRGYYSRRLKNTWGVHKRKDKLDLDEQMLFTKIYKYTAQRVGLIPAPDVYLRRDQALGIRNANSDPPSVIIGADMTQNKGDRQLAFLIGKHLCWMRPEHYLGSVGFPTENLKLMFMATMHITDPSLGIDQQLGDQGGAVIKELKKLPAQMLTQLRKYMQKYLSQGKNPNLSAWLTQVEHTSIRMGLVLCGDLHQAASCIKNDANPIGKATVKDKIREMVLFSISDEYFEIRKKLGLDIG